MREPTQEIRELVETYRRLFRCSVCLHDYTGDVGRVADVSLRNHTNAFCRAVKDGMALGKRCVTFDLNELRYRLSAGQGEALIKVCHAGALEFVAPIFSERSLRGCVFVGPFRVGTPISGAEALTQTPSKLKFPVALIPEIDASRLEDMLRMTRLLAEKIGGLIAALGDDYRQIVGYAGKIRYFLDHNYRVGVSLGDLADFLSLSVSRTSRLVKSRTGMTFPAALAERRIERARFLLKNSAFNMEAIAEQCGFSDVAYFFKVFKQRQKISPAAYRRQNDSSLVANGP